MIERRGVVGGDGERCGENMKELNNVFDREICAVFNQIFTAVKQHNRDLSEQSWLYINITVNGAIVLKIEQT